jgi:hypothetical protein
VWQTINLAEASVAVEILLAAAEAMTSSPLRSGSCVELPPRGRLLATGDLHDNPTHFEAIVALARLDASEDHHLVLHEIIHSDVLVNGVDLSHRMLLKVAALVGRYPRQVHLLLANHELAQYTGQGVSKGAGNSVTLFDDGLAFVYGERADEVGAACARLIRALPLAARSVGTVLCAHSLPDSESGFDSGVLARPLRDEDYAGRPSPGDAYRMVWGRRYTDDQVETWAQRWGVELFCLGHQHTATGIEVRGKRVLVLNSDHALGAALPIDLANPPTPEDAILTAVRLRSVLGAQTGPPSMPEGIERGGPRRAAEGERR